MSQAAMLTLRYRRLAGCWAMSLSPPDLRASRPDRPTPEEISAIRLAWEDLAA